MPDIEVLPTCRVCYSHTKMMNSPRLIQAVIVINELREQLAKYDVILAHRTPGRLNPPISPR